MDKKVCNICYKEKSLSRFPRKGKNRRRGYCKECRRVKRELKEVSQSELKTRKIGF